MMKRLLLSLFLLALGLSGFGQSNINADCVSALPLCSNPSFTFNSTSGVGTYSDIPTNNNISNPSTNPASQNSGCLLAGELKPQWLLITIGNTGFLEFVFGASSSSFPQAGFYDWAMWKYSPTACADIMNNTLAPVRCNWNGSSSGGTGIASTTNIPQGGSASNFEPPLPVLACEQYIICISNYSGVNTLVSFASIGTSSLSCNPNCLVATTDAEICAGSAATIVAASSSTIQNITYSIQPTGQVSNTPTFVVTPSFNTTYTIFATGQGQFSVVTQTATSNVTVHPMPAANPTFTNSTCTSTFNAFNLNLTFTPQASTGYTVTWNPVPSGIGSPTQTASHPSIVTAPGVYNATITSAGNCSVTAAFTISPPPSAADFSLSPAGPVYSITCFQPTVNITATMPSYNYTWTNGLIAAQNGSVASMTNGGTGVWTITAEHPVSKCIATKTIMVGQNTVMPVSSITPTFQNITCTLTSVTNVSATVISPTVNNSSYFLSPYGGTVYGTLYVPGGTGTYTHFLQNTVNGCVTGKTFTVNSSQGFPTFSLTSPQSFTLGCNSRSVAIIDIVGAQATPTSAGAVSYTLFNTQGLPSSTNSTTSTYQVNVPGTYTAVVRNTANGCETRVPVAVLSNTLPPGIDTVLVPTNILTCYTPSVLLKGISLAPNVNFNWKLPNSLNISGQDLTVNADFTARTKTLVGTYTFVVEDNSSTCTSSVSLDILQNVFEPIASIAKSSPSITCITNSVLLTNISSSGIQGIFPKSLPVVGFIWDGPSPQIRNQLTTTYWATMVGDYTMTARDLNNGCVTTTVTYLGDARNYPLVNTPPMVPEPTVIDCGSERDTLVPTIMSGTTNLSYKWIAPTGAITSTLDGGLRLVSNKSGDYRVIVTDKDNGCSTSADMKMIMGTLSVSFTSDRETGFAPLEVNFTNTSASSLGSASIEAVWQFGNGADTTVFDQPQTRTLYTQPGKYRVILNSRKGECIGADTHYVFVDIPSGLGIPNVFTPNGDGVNDEYFLRTKNLSEISLMIIDRWGRIVYELTSNTGNVLWDGTDQKGRVVADGVYTFVLTAKGTDGKDYEEKGSISLLR